MRDAAIAIIREIGVEAGGCNIQFAVNPADGEQLVIEMNPAGLPLVGAGLQGHRLSHRADRHQAGGRLHARRAAQRHHQDHPGLVRAGARLRRGQGSPLRVREVPHRRFPPHHPDEIGGGGDGHRPHVQGSAPEGTAGARDRPARVEYRRDPRRRPAEERFARGLAGRRCARRRRNGSFRSSARSSRDCRSTTIAKASGFDPWFLHQLAELVAAERQFTAVAGEPDAAALRHMKRLGFTDQQLGDAARDHGGEDPGAALGAPGASRLQDGGHLRWGIPVEHAVSLLVVRRRERVGPAG